MPTAYTYRFEQAHAVGRPVFRPVVRVRLSGPSGHSTVPMVIDSGADLSVIRPRLAERLGLDLGPLEGVDGVSGSTPAYRSRVAAEVLFDETAIMVLELPVLVPVNRDFPPVNLLGREEFFNSCEVRFRLGHLPEHGGFTLIPLAGSPVAPRES